MAKKKSKKSQKYRRKNEIIKAQRGAYRGAIKEEIQQNAPKTTLKEKKITEKYALPEEIIKKDISKVLLFAALSIVFLIVMKTNSLDIILALFQRQ